MILIRPVLLVLFALCAQGATVVKHLPDAKPQDIDAFHAKFGGKRYQNFRWSCAPHGSEREFANACRTSKLFELPQESRRCSIAEIPNDPFFAQQWALQKISASAGWNIARSNTVIVAILDTGISYEHEDLQGNLWTGPAGEHGYTALSGEICEGGRDDHHHGTHVAGIVGATGNNGLGISGVNWNVKLMSMKFLAGNGFGTTEDAALCIDRMIQLKRAGYNIKVSNNSWGSSGFDGLLFDAFAAAESNGIINICAAGNDSANTDVNPFSPASLPLDGIISVLASTESDTKAFFSNYGVVSTDLLAPGVDVLSLDLSQGYLGRSGTSMASPHVAGVCALLFSINTNLTVARCRSVLLHPGSLDQAQFTQTSTFGGRLNMAKTLSSPLIFEPQTNNNPALRVTSDNPLVIAPGLGKSASVIGADADGDSLSYSATAVPSLSNENQLFNEMLGQYFGFQTVTTNTIAITNYPKGIALGYDIRFGVTDGKGGTASSSVGAFMSASPDKTARLPTPIATLTNMETYPFWSFEVTGMPATARYAIHMAANNYPEGNNCCYSVGTPIPFYRPLVYGPNIIRAYVMDTDGNFITSPRVLFDFGGSGLYAPEVKVSLNTTNGPAPLKVIADMRWTDPGGSRGLWYYTRQWRGEGSFGDVHEPVHEFTLTKLGAHPIEFVAYDPASGITDIIVQMITVTPGRPVLSIGRSGTNLTLHWTSSATTDVLETSANLTTWTPFQTGLPPVTVTANGTSRYFRLRK